MIYIAVENSLSLISSFKKLKQRDLITIHFLILRKISVNIPEGAHYDDSLTTWESHTRKQDTLHIIYSVDINL